MTQPQADFDRTDLRYVLTCAVKLGVLEAIAVGLFSLTERFLEGPAETVVLALIVLAGVAAVTLLPGIWTVPRTIEGIAGAAGIGLAATVVFLLIDVASLQPLGAYTNRWHEIGGGSNWWYHPVWWMVGTFLPWMGAFAMANQAARRGDASPVLVMGTALGLTALVAVVAVVAGFPGAELGLGTVAVAFLPGIALTVLVTSLGARRG